MLNTEVCEVTTGSLRIKISLLKAESSLGDSTYYLFCTVKMKTLLYMHQTTWCDILDDWDLKSHTGYKNTCND